MTPPQDAGIWETPRIVRELIAARIARGETSQNELFRKTGITQGAISQILSGRKRGSTFTVYTLAEAAGIRITVRIAELELQPQRLPRAETRRTGPPPSRTAKRGRKQVDTHPFRGDVSGRMAELDRLIRRDPRPI